MPTHLPAATVASVLSLAAPAAEVRDWQVVADAYPVRTPSTGGLDRVSATTADGRHVSVFVKTLQSLRHWPLIATIPERARASVVATFPWRVEADVYASTLLDVLPSGLRGPRIYLVEDLGEDRIRVWMEDVRPSDAIWDIARYQRAGRLLGRLAGRCIGSDAPSGAPPLFPGLRFQFVGRTAATDIPAIRNEELWRDPALAAATSEDPALRPDLLRLADLAPDIVDGLEELPQTLAHGDACPQNLLADPAAAEGFVLIDWGFAALAPIGYDLGQLVMGRANDGDVDVSDMPMIEREALAAYCAGLADESVEISIEDVRRGFLGGMLLRSAFAVLPLAELASGAGSIPEGHIAARARLLRHLLDLGRTVTDL
jgi:hypothetical protein